MRICISTWGDPSQWKYARYCLDNEKCSEGFSTLNLLLDRDRFGCQKVYIYALDTVAKALHESYSDIANDAREYIEKYLCIDNLDNVEINVLPGRMRKKISFGDSEAIIEFSGNLEDLRILIAYSLYMKILEYLIKLNNKDVNIVVDTTHGINYLPSIAIKAVNEAIAVLSTATLSRIYLYIYNADPYPQDISKQYVDKLKRSNNDICRADIDRETEAPKLIYNRLSKEIVTPWHLTQFLYYTRDLRVIEFLGPRSNLCKIDDYYIRNLVKLAKRIVASFRVGIVPQLLIYIKENRNMDKDIERVLESIMECWKDQASVNKEYDRYIVKYGKIGQGVRLLLHTHAIIIGVKRVLEDQGTGDFITLSDVDRIERKLFNDFIISSTLISREREKLEKLKSSNMIIDNWTVYTTVRQNQLKLQQGDLCRESLETFIGKKNEEKRVLIAHAGFHSDLIEVRKINKDIAIRIREECKDKIEILLDDVAEDLIH